MTSILTVKNLKDFPQKFAKGKKVVLVGGCFDILHPGHVIFLEKARKQGDILIVLLESDQKIKQLKGHGRPVHSQQDRALVLSSVRFVDFIIPIPYFDKEKEYDAVIEKIRPHIIATTRGISDHHHQRSAQKIGAKLKYVTNIIGDYSTTRILGD